MLVDNMAVSLQIIAFDELRTDFKNPIEQGNPSRAVRFSDFFNFSSSCYCIAEPLSSCGIEKGPYSISTAVTNVLYLSACFV